MLDVGRRYTWAWLHITQAVYRRETDTLNKEHIAGRRRGKLYWFWRFPLEETPGSQWLCVRSYSIRSMPSWHVGPAKQGVKKNHRSSHLSEAAGGSALVTQKGTCLSGRIGHISFCFRIKPHCSPLFCLTQSSEGCTVLMGVGRNLLQKE